MMSADVVIQLAPPREAALRVALCLSVCPVLLSQFSVLFRSYFGKTKLIYDAVSVENKFTPNRRGLVTAISLT